MNRSENKNISELIRRKALDLGFDLCGIAKAKPLDKRRNVLEKWCLDGMNAEMHYLARDVDRRTNPSLLFPGAESVVVTGLNYFTGIPETHPGVPVISRYAYGTDYHIIVGEKLEKLLDYIKSEYAGAEGRPFVDSGPVLEKAWAVEAGIGWQGRHSVIINSKLGSFFFIGVLILNIKLDYDEPEVKDYCGTCRSCIDACPTSAINDNRTIDSRKCIANLTIEKRGPVPDDIVPKLGGRVYGCDICQDVCPWNIKPVLTHVKEFEMPETIRLMTLGDWKNLSEEQFRTLFALSPVARRKYEPFMRNVRLVTR
jgi:epoxyqueuosine reductase